MTDCFFCDEHVDPDNPENFRQVTSWVSGPKLDGPVLRQQTGAVAHKECIDKRLLGQAPDQQALFAVPDSGIVKEISLGDLKHLDPPSDPPLYGGEMADRMFTVAKCTRCGGVNTCDEICSNP